MRSKCRNNADKALLSMTLQACEGQTKDDISQVGRLEKDCGTGCSRLSTVGIKFENPC